MYCDLHAKHATMSVKLYVGNLAEEVDDEALWSMFEQHGTLESAKVKTDWKTWKSLGFAFVTYTSEEAADKAIKYVCFRVYLLHPRDCVIHACVLANLCLAINVCCLPGIWTASK